MAINVSDLPPKYQAQAMKKYIEQEQCRGPAESATPEQPGGSKPSKYHNIKTERITEKGTVIHFDSQKEARRYDEIMSMLRGALIRNLQLQHEFTLQAAFTTPEGERIRAIRYLADFTYEKAVGASWELVVEDVKSKATKTAVYSIKRKMMQERLGIEIIEV